MRDLFKTFNSRRATFFLLVFICVIVAGAVLKITASVILPLTIATLLAFVLYPLILGLDKLRVPRGISIVLMVLLIVAGLLLFGRVVFYFGREILSSYNGYEKRFSEIYKWFAEMFNLPYDEELSFWEMLWSQVGIRTRIWTMTSSMANMFTEFLKNTFMVVLFVGFLLVEATQFKEKLQIAFEERSEQIQQIGFDVVRQVTRYLTAKFFISLANGIVVAICLGLTGLQFAIMWGLIQFMLNFIPTFGSIAAGFLIGLFALLQFWPEPGPIIIVVAIILGTNLITYILDPKIVGDNVGISPFVVIASLVIWGYLWGFAGMILAVPMMVIIRIICENFEFLTPVSILLGSRKSVLAQKAKIDSGNAAAAKRRSKKTSNGGEPAAVEENKHAL